MWVFFACGSRDSWEMSSASCFPQHNCFHFSRCRFIKKKRLKTARSRCANFERTLNFWIIKCPEFFFVIQLSKLQSYLFLPHYYYYYFLTLWILCLSGNGTTRIVASQLPRESVSKLISLTVLLKVDNSFHGTLPTKQFQNAPDWLLHLQWLNSFYSGRRRGRSQHRFSLDRSSTGRRRRLLHFKLQLILSLVYRYTPTLWWDRRSCCALATTVFFHCRFCYIHTHNTLFSRRERRHKARM